MSSLKEENETTSGAISEQTKRDMYETFNAWALQNYGDSGKTKTVTRKKYMRIVNILTGEEESSTDNSKFRFWVKAKGFRLGPVKGVKNGIPDQKVLYVPSKQTNDSNFNETVREYKQVAIVEDFFNIIYSVHVEMDGRGGKHAGQKRTYRAIAETYSFLPREAVTRFLMSCADCQKRMHIACENNVIQSDKNDADHSIISSYNDDVNSVVTSTEDDPHIIDFRVPITQTYLNHMRNKGYFSAGFQDKEESVSSMESEVSGEQSPTPVPDASSLADKAQTESSSTHVNGGIGRATPVNLAKTSPADIQAEELTPVNASNSKSASPSTDRGHPERKRRASEDSMEEATRSSETGTNDDLSGLKDEDDEDDNDDEEKIPPGHHYDPERLKAFNMFVRLFVDENLDRMVPISKQPKDKIQAILEACDRQFPEFHERSRKRIRTYLKSCRRMRRSKEQNGWEPLRPTPPHLTSAAAESLLAQACENEGQNAKRMRMGLEPLAASAMNTMNPLSVVPTTSQPQKPTMAPSPPPSSQPATAQQTLNNSAPSIDRHTPASTDFLRTQAPPPAFRPPPEFHAPFFPNGNGLFRPGFPPGYQHPAHHHPPVLQHSPIQPATVQNGPTDLSMKKNSSKNQLSTSEVATIKQLIAGYRESAAFLYRSADELEQLLLQQS